MGLPRVARRACLARVLLGSADVHDRQARVVEAVSELLPGGNCVQLRLEGRPRLLQVDRALLDLARPAGEALGEDGDVRMARELSRLRRGGGADAVAAVVEHEPLPSGDA